jgi:hypothetical protein
MFTTADVNIHALIAKYGIDIQIVRPEMTKFKMFREFSKHGFLFWFQLQLFFLLHCDEWDRVVALPRHKFVTGVTLLQATTLFKCIDRFP